MKRSRPLRPLVVLAFVAAGLSLAPVEAGFDIDLGASIRVGDDADLYLAVSSRYFGQDRTTVDRFAVHYSDPDDLAVALYLGRRAGRSCDDVLRLRRTGLSWWDISVRFGLPANIWFVAVDRDPGPPYGKAYGHWKRHKRNKRHAFVISDDDARHLVAVRVLHEYYGVDVPTAMEWRASGRNLRSLVAAEYHRRHGKPASKSHPKRGKPGKAHGKGKKH